MDEIIYLAIMGKKYTCINCSYVGYAGNLYKKHAANCNKAKAENKSKGEVRNKSKEEDSIIMLPVDETQHEMQHEIQHEIEIKFQKLLERVSSQNDVDVQFFLDLYQELLGIDRSELSEESLEKFEALHRVCEDYLLTPEVQAQLVSQ